MIEHLSICDCLTWPAGLYSKTVLYSVYDVTAELKASTAVAGKHAVGVELGNGWWNPMTLKMCASVPLSLSLSVALSLCFCLSPSVFQVGAHRRARCADSRPGAWQRHNDRADVSAEAPRHDERRHAEDAALELRGWGVARQRLADDVQQHLPRRTLRRPKRAHPREPARLVYRRLRRVFLDQSRASCRGPSDSQPRHAGAADGAPYPPSGRALDGRRCKSDTNRTR